MTLHYITLALLLTLTLTIHYITLTLILTLTLTLHYMTLHYTTTYTALHDSPLSPLSPFNRTVTLNGSNDFRD